MPRESLDAPENLPKESRRQVALGQPQDEVPGVPNEAPAGLEQPRLEARQRPALDGDQQDEPAQQLVEVVGDDRQESPHRIGVEAVARGPGPVPGFLVLLDPLLRRRGARSRRSPGESGPRRKPDSESSDSGPAGGGWAGHAAGSRGQQPKRRVLGQPRRVAGVLVASQTAIDGLAEEVRQRKLAIVPSAGIGEVSIDQRA